MSILMAGCASSPEAGPTKPTSKVDAGTTAPSPRPLLYLRGGVEVAIYADGRVIWPIGDGDPGYLQMRLTPEAVERLRSRAVSTGLFEQDQGLTVSISGGKDSTCCLEICRLAAEATGSRPVEAVCRDEEIDHRPGSMEVRRGSMEVRRDDRSVIVVWGEDPSAIRSWARAVVSRALERTSAATAEQEIEVIELEAFFRDPTEWRLPSSWYVQPEISPFVPSRLLVVYDQGAPDWSTLPSPARQIVSNRLEGLTRPTFSAPRGDGCQVISTDQAREIARALTQAGIGADYDSQRGLLGFQAAGSFVHSFPALPHEVACETRWPGGA